ncbi:MAG: hypothetical protein RIB97_10225 [Nitratireductor sp.]
MNDGAKSAYFTTRRSVMEMKKALAARTPSVSWVAGNNDFEGEYLSGVADEKIALSIEPELADELFQLTVYVMLHDPSPYVERLEERFEEVKRALEEAGARFE